MEIYQDPSGVQEFMTPKDRHAERRRDVHRRTLNFPLVCVLVEEQVPPFDWKDNGPSLWEVGTWRWYEQDGTMWVPCGPQLIMPKELQEAITCKPKVGLEPDNNR
jgi:hypothetical protein